MRVDNSSIVESLFDSISDEYFMKVRERGGFDQTKADPESVFHPEVIGLIRSLVPDLSHCKVCVLGSGDNLAALALAFMGAEVTSVDISARQIQNASAVAERMGAHLRFVCDDAMTLGKIEDGAFDLVYTSNGFLTFISDLGKLDASIARVLKGGGFYVLFDTHPFMRPFGGYLREVVVKKPYEAIGPFTSSYVFHWRVEDIINPIAASGLRIHAMRELHALPGTFWTDFIHDEEQLGIAYDWRENGLAGLPQWLVISAVKTQE